MMPDKISLPSNPVFASVTGLTNTAFDAEQVVPDRGASEGQLAALNAALATARAEMEAIIESDDGMLQALWDRTETLAAQIEECCTVDHGSAALTEIWARLEELGARIEESCGCFSGGEQAAASDNVITVSFAWNGENKLTAGGTATAVCSDSERAITGFHFLARDPNTGLYFKSSVANGGWWTWSIDSSGNVTASNSGSAGNHGASRPIAIAIVAVDDQGGEGAVGVSLPHIVNVAG